MCDGDEQRPEIRRGKSADTAANQLGQTPAAGLGAARACASSATEIRRLAGRGPGRKQAALRPDFWLGTRVPQCSKAGKAGGRPRFEVARGGRPREQRRVEVS